MKDSRNQEQIKTNALAMKNYIDMREKEMLKEFEKEEQIELRLKEKDQIEMEATFDKLTAIGFDL